MCNTRVGRLLYWPEIYGYEIEHSRNKAKGMKFFCTNVFARRRDLQRYDGHRTEREFRIGSVLLHESHRCSEFNQICKLVVVHYRIFIFTIKQATYLFKVRPYTVAQIDQRRGNPTFLN